ncbi:P-loop containing nucleoside triphosphate hydrolase protein [Schizophyllum commune]
MKTLRSGSSIGAAVLQKNDYVVALALASVDRVLIVKKPEGCKDGPVQPLFQKLESALFSQGRRVFVLDGNKFALLIHHDLKIRIGNCVDLLSVSDGDRAAKWSYVAALGGDRVVNVDAVKRLMSRIRGKQKMEDIALQAWAAAYAGQLPSMKTPIQTVERINTHPFESVHLEVLWINMYDQERRDALKPLRVQNEITSAKIGKKKGNLQVVSKRFKTRVMRMQDEQSAQFVPQHIEITHTVNNREVTVRGKATKIDGRTATITCPETFRTTGKLEVKLTTVGREAGTMAERMRTEIIHCALRRMDNYDLFSIPLFCSIYLPNVPWSGGDMPPEYQTACEPTLTARPLNRSQVAAVKRVLSPANADRVCLIQGPPGTGKTTVIAACVQSITSVSRTRTVWLVAQSNVAVKNMAEKLADVDFWDFRILVSKDFHYDWHEHLYHQIEQRLIRSDNFPENAMGAERMVLGARVMLCTLSCLSVDRIQSITKVVPLQTVLVDEASQIEVGDFVPMIHQYRETLQKIVFIGDDKQHRMPIQLGSFISKNVYKGKLKSQHLIRTPCISFINVVHGQEKSVGTSWTNEREVTTIVALARKYMQEGKNFRVITPYDPQRGAIEAALKHADLKWEDTVFNVDSFQGNECDHIIVSLVRSGHKLGFLALQRRSMTIVTKRAFIEGAGASSLAGKLAKACGSGAWSDA